MLLFTNTKTTTHERKRQYPKFQNHLKRTLEKRNRSRDAQSFRCSAGYSIRFSASNGSRCPAPPYSCSDSQTGYSRSSRCHSSGACFFSARLSDSITGLFCIPSRFCRNSNQHTSCCHSCKYCTSRNPTELTRHSSRWQLTYTGTHHPSQNRRTPYSNFTRGCQTTCSNWCADYSPLIKPESRD